VPADRGVGFGVGCGVVVIEDLFLGEHRHLLLLLDPLLLAGLEEQIVGRLPRIESLLQPVPPPKLQKESVLRVVVRVVSYRCSS
jgi:hypothetical protein